MREWGTSERVHTLHLIAIVRPSIRVVVACGARADEDAAVGALFQKPEFHRQHKVAVGGI